VPTLGPVIINPGYEPPEARVATCEAGVCLGKPRFGYETALGEGISRDPLKNAELRQGPNLYGYVLNNPINLIDAFGLDWSTAAQAIWNAAGYAVSGSEIPGAAAAAPDAARILIIAQFKKACEDCLEKAINDGTYCPKSCPICDEYKKVQAALGGD
jgi:RHS repeat-associated protein